MLLRRSHSKRWWSAEATIRVIMRSTTRGRVCPAFFRAPCFGALLLPPARLSVVGAYAIAATTTLIADARPPRERDEFGTGQNARERLATMLRERLRRAGDREDGAAESPDWERATRRPEERSTPTSSAAVGRKGERSRLRRTTWCGRPCRHSRRPPKILRSRSGREGLRRQVFGGKREPQSMPALEAEGTYWFFNLTESLLARKPLSELF